jgi:hypothetical protein
MINAKDDRLGDIIIELSWGFVLSYGLSDHPPTKLHLTHRGCTAPAPLRCFRFLGKPGRYELSDTSHPSAMAVTQRINYRILVVSCVVKCWVYYLLHIFGIAIERLPVLEAFPEPQIQPPADLHHEGKHW